MFTFDEVEALAAGARMVESWGGPVLAAAARTALLKIEQALPPDRRAEVEATKLFAPGFHIDKRTGQLLETVRQAIAESRKLLLAYMDKDGTASERTVRPAGLSFWGPNWTMTAWCETREDFRNFRLDRVSRLKILDQRFEAERGKTLEDFLRRMQG